MTNSIHNPIHLSKTGQEKPSEKRELLATKKFIVMYPNTITVCIGFDVLKKLVSIGGFFYFCAIVE